jgi:hypothetical protein
MIREGYGCTWLSRIFRSHLRRAGQRRPGAGAGAADLPDYGIFCLQHGRFGVHRDCIGHSTNLKQHWSGEDGWVAPIARSRVV